MEFLLDEVRVKGRAAKPVAGAVVRELVETDLALLGEEKGSTATPLKRISERHHALARNLAGGMKPGEAGIVCGYDASRVSILQADPAFKELVEFYRADVDRVYRGMHEQLAAASSLALDIMQDRLEDEELAKEVSMGQLIEVAKMGADRTGHGPASTSTNVNVNVDLANRLQAARERVRARQIEGKVE